MTIIRLRSSDGEVFVTDETVVKSFGTIRKMLELCEIGEGEDDVIPLPNVNSAILRKILEWATFHKDDPVRLEDAENEEKRTLHICPWDVEFLKVDQSTLFDLIMAGNYLDAKGLLDSACKTLANMIRGREVEEIRRTFNIQSDLTPEEEQIIRNESSLLDDFKEQM